MSEQNKYRDEETGKISGGDNVSPVSKRRDFLKLVPIGIGIAAGLSVTGSGLGKKISGETGAGDKVKVLTPDGKLVEADASHIKALDDIADEAGARIRQGVPNKKFVMVIDLSRCKNARMCIEGCQKMHHVLPPVEWIKVKEMQNAVLTSPYWFPQLCYQCDNPPCTKVCPVDATFKRTDGIVGIDNERCIGCKFCMAACPYSARSFNFGKKEQVEHDAANKQNPNQCHSTNPGRVGTVSKCDFCPDAAAKGILPACVKSCPNGVIFYGDEYEDSVSNGESVVQLSKFLKDNAAYRQFEELGTLPRVYYLPPVNRLFPFKEDTILHNQE